MGSGVHSYFDFRAHSVKVLAWDADAEFVCDDGGEFVKDCVAFFIENVSHRLLSSTNDLYIKRFIRLGFREC